jgi:hypothetical protein
MAACAGFLRKFSWEVLHQSDDDPTSHQEVYNSYIANWRDFLTRSLPSNRSGCGTAAYPGSYVAVSVISVAVHARGISDKFELGFRNSARFSQTSVQPQM